MSDETKLPWFKFEPQVWLSDKDVRKLSHAQRGIYMDLLSIDWISRGLPENPTDACNLLTGGAKVKDVAPVLALFKVKIGDGLVTHKRSERQRQEFAEKSEQSRAAIKSRWNRVKGGVPVPNPNQGESFESGTPVSRSNDSRNGSRNTGDIPRALARDEDKEEDKDKKTSPEKSISPPKGSEKIDSRGGASLSRPDSEEAAIKLCRAQMTGNPAPDDFVAKCFHGLNAVEWLDATGTKEIANFPSYVRKAWLNERDDRARRADIAGKGGQRGGFGRPEPEVKRQGNGKVSTGIDYSKEGK